MPPMTVRFVARNMSETADPVHQGDPVQQVEQTDTPAAAAARMQPHRQLTRFGTGSALLAVVAAVVALIDYPPTTGRDIWFPVGALAAAVVLLLICAVQLVVWRAAFSAWRADRPFDGAGAARATTVSWWLHLLSYPVLLAGLYLSIEASALGGFSELPGFMLGLEVLFLLLAQVTAAVQYLRADGGPGTIPNHLRALLAKVQAQR